ncbi:MAG TPA: 4'-phosphopantetheinyl transferase superfamily protein [Cellvibrio sp.]|nr:4'-phosphopantetheinyl transferase superfamily protein [Cellvibrio sp.]
MRQRKSKVENKNFSFTPLADTAQKIKGADIWLLDFSLLTENQITNLSKSLSQEELTRAQAVKHKQQHFLATRALVRKVLAYYTGIPSASLEFARREQGKPYLANTPSPIYFNVSHSGNFAVLAVTTLGEIGIDIETIRPRNFLAIAERYYHADELKQLTATPEAERESLFFKLWTLKEAFFKATGGGISSGLDKAIFSFSDTKINSIFCESLNLPNNNWQFQQEFITPTTLVALALLTTEIIQRQWFDGNAMLG